MTYTATCDKCDGEFEDPFLMAQFHEDEFMNHPIGDRLKDAGYDLSDTITFCPECTIEILT